MRFGWFTDKLRYQKAMGPLIFKSLESVLNVLEKPEHKANTGIQELLKIFKATKEKAEKIVAGDKLKHPLIILEGLDGSGKSTMVKLLAKKINGVQWQTPPQSISHLRSTLDDDKQLRTAFYSLGNYLAALETQIMLRGAPVVMDRYWHSTAAFSLAQAVHDSPEEFQVPPKGDEIYEWPQDLFKPDIVMLLDVKEHIRMQRISNRTEFTAQELLLKTDTEFRENVILAYKNMFNPGVKLVDGNLYPRQGLKLILTEVEPLI